MNPERLSRQYHQTGTLTPKVTDAFRQTIYDRYHANPRPMPWRETHDPYPILVSEVMLQQTQVERVKAKYAQFLTFFPTLADLAAAPLEVVLRVWQGLGYNRRAIALKRCAEDIVTRYNGLFPETIAELESLPGIGPYTARAVSAFAFGVAEPFIETNIRTVVIHFFFHGRENIHDRMIMPLVAETLDHGNPREWYYALMDYGVMLKQLHPNPSRRSSHHIRQSPFKGSNRELRSRMLRAILDQPGITTRELTDLLSADEAVVVKNLGALAREGFADQRGEGFVVRD
ncbi:MAG: A/G-specific adenine glycosylase [Desulfuromonadales bacterium]|nr:A/G-specific adenine glycosylase [Desulfuromonadales bacterium]